MRPDHETAHQEALHAAFMGQIEPARPEERVPAFRLVFQHLDPAEQDTRVANALRLLSEGELSPDAIFVARENRTLRGAMVCVLLHGAGGLLWPPFVRAGPAQLAAEDRLVRTGLDWLQRQGAKLVQAIVTTGEMPLAIPLVRNGLRHITRLNYMRHALKRHVPEPAEQLSVRTYAQADAAEFRRTLVRTYAGSQDCPELNGVRTIEEILEGHEAQGAFDPNHWWLAFYEGQPVGVLLMTQVADWNALDISYLGVVPEARHQGVGRELTQLALRAATAAGVQQVTLAVDARNRAASNLYGRMGFELWNWREAYLLIFAHRQI